MFHDDFIVYVYQFGETPIHVPAAMPFGLMFVVLAIIEFFPNIASWAEFGWVSEKIVYYDRVPCTQTQFLIVVSSLRLSTLLWSQMFALAPELSVTHKTITRSR